MAARTRSKRYKIVFPPRSQRGRADNDGGYHLLFSYARMIADLLAGFVDEPWVAELDFSTLKRVNAKFHADGLERRDGDVIWRVRRRGGGYAYLYIAVEFQSKVDRWMSLRLAIYILLLYAHLIRENRLGPDGLLPPVYPIVLYNGDAAWTAKLELAELVAPGPDGDPWPWRPRFRYHVLEERKPTPEPLGASPEATGNVTAILFELERCRTYEDLAALVGRVVKLLHQNTDAPLRRAFLAWLRAVLAPRGIKITHAEVAALTEERDMLADRVREWEKELLDRGCVMGRAQSLIHLLERRFGPLPDDRRERIMRADASEIDAWFDRISIDAPSPDAVLTGPSVH